MKKIDRGKFMCNFCGKVFPNPNEADGCEKSHNLIYIPMTDEELSSLVMFLHTGDIRLAKQSVIRRIVNYKRVTSEDNMSPLFNRGD